MTITTTYNKFSDLFHTVPYSHYFTKLPLPVQEGFDNYFDQTSFDLTDSLWMQEIWMSKARTFDMVQIFKELGYTHPYELKDKANRDALDEHQYQDLEDHLLQKYGVNIVVMYQDVIYGYLEN